MQLLPYVLDLSDTGFEPTSALLHALHRATHQPSLEELARRDRLWMAEAALGALNIATHFERRASESLLGALRSPVGSLRFRLALRNWEIKSAELATARAAFLLALSL